MDTVTRRPNGVGTFEAHCGLSMPHACGILDAVLRKSTIFLAGISVSTFSVDCIDGLTHKGFSREA